MTGILVLTASQFDPGVGRAGSTLPDWADTDADRAPGAARRHGRRYAAGPGRAGDRSRIQHRRNAPGHAVRPRPGVRVVLRVVPGAGALRAVLTIVVAIAAVAMTAMFAAPLGAALGIGAASAGGLISLGVNVIGSLLVNALVPPVKPKQDKRANDYTTGGWRNRYEPDGAVPVVLGSLRYAPPFASTSYSGDRGRQTVRARPVSVRRRPPRPDRFPHRRDIDLGI